MSRKKKYSTKKQSNLKKAHSLSFKDVKVVFFVPIFLVAILTPLLLVGGKLQPWLNFFILGFFLSLWFKDLRLLLFSGTLSGLLSLQIWSLLLNPSFFLNTLNIRDPLVFGDVIFGSVFENLLYATLNFDFSGYPVIFKAVGFVLFFGAGYYFQSLIQRITKSSLKKKTAVIEFLPFYVSLIILLVLLLYSFFFSYGSQRAKLAQTLEKGEYATDYSIYKRTYELMKNSGMSYYRALNKAKNEDARNISDPSAWSIPTPFWVRQPFVFYLWKFLGMINPQLILIFALFLFFAGFFLIALYSERHLFKGSSLLLLSIIYPFFYLSFGWEEIFLPDFWGSLFLLISVGLFLNLRFFSSLFFAQLASLCRVLYAGFYLVVFVLVVFRFAKDGLKRTVPAFFIGSLFPVLYIFHILNVLNKHSYLLTAKTQSFGLGIIFNLNPEQALRNLTWISNFLSYPYTFHLVHGVVWLFVSILLFLLSLIIKGKNVNSGNLIFGLSVTLFSIVFSASNHVSQYWNAILFPQVLLLIYFSMIDIGQSLLPAEKLKVS